MANSQYGCVIVIYSKIIQKLLFKKLVKTCSRICTALLGPDIKAQAFSQKRDFSVFQSVLTFASVTDVIQRQHELHKTVNRTLSSIRITRTW